MGQFGSHSNTCCKIEAPEIKKLLVDISPSYRICSYQKERSSGVMISHRTMHFPHSPLQKGPPFPAPMANAITSNDGRRLHFFASAESWENFMHARLSEPSALSR
ncbi:Contactin-1 [Platysternon megacephalum]|uniref:Contactin-1 n=1 Tax=Platysternon megacephalum TaxID=55544 RepID=A0A4D9EHD2_9SAUR|nr:Contactin-1 [Platysternon megacephalum]